MYLIKAYSRNSAQRLILAPKGHFFMKKRALFLKKAYKIFHPSYSIPILSFLHQNKALYNFRKRRQCSIVKSSIERNRGLKYTLLVASNAHISTTLSHPRWKNVNDWTKFMYRQCQWSCPWKFWSIFLMAR